MGVALDDFLALGWVFYNMSRHEGMNRFQPEVLRQFGIGQDVIAVRFQYAIQRIFGDHPYLETKYLVSEADTKRGDRFRSAVDDVFESRVGEVLDRISGYEGPGGGGVLITERQMKLAWHTKKEGEDLRLCIRSR